MTRVPIPRLMRMPGASALALALVLILALVAVVSMIHPARAEAQLQEFLHGTEPGILVPGADRFGPPEGDPPVVAAFADDELKGWVWLNSDFVGAAGYSGKPIRILAGMTPDGTLTGAKLVEHHEPIVLVGIPEQRIVDFINGYVGHRTDELVARSAGGLPVDIVSGATVTVMVIADSLIRSAARVLRQQAGGSTSAAEASTTLTVQR